MEKKVPPPEPLPRQCGRGQSSSSQASLDKGKPSGDITRRGIHGNGGRGWVSTGNQMVGRGMSNETD